MSRNVTPLFTPVDILVDARGRHAWRMWTFPVPPVDGRWTFSLRPPTTSVVDTPDDDDYFLFSPGIRCTFITPLRAAATQPHVVRVVVSLRLCSRVLFTTYSPAAAAGCTCVTTRPTSGRVTLQRAARRRRDEG